MASNPLRSSGIDRAGAPRRDPDPRMRFAFSIFIFSECPRRVVSFCAKLFALLSLYMPELALCCNRTLGGDGDMVWSGLIPSRPVAPHCNSK